MDLDHDDDLDDDECEWNESFDLEKALAEVATRSQAKENIEPRAHSHRREPNSNMTTPKEETPSVGELKPPAVKLASFQSLEVPLNDGRHLSPSSIPPMMMPALQSLKSVQSETSPAVKCSVRFQDPNERQPDRSSSLKGGLIIPGPVGEWLARKQSFVAKGQRHEDALPVRYSLAAAQQAEASRKGPETETSLLSRVKEDSRRAFKLDKAQWRVKEIRMHEECADLCLTDGQQTIQASAHLNCVGDRFPEMREGSLLHLKDVSVIRWSLHHEPVLILTERNIEKVDVCGVENGGQAEGEDPFISLTQFRLANDLIRLGSSQPSSDISDHVTGGIESVPSHTVASETVTKGAEVVQTTQHVSNQQRSTNSTRICSTELDDDVEVIEIGHSLNSELEKNILSENETKRHNEESEKEITPTQPDAAMPAAATPIRPVATQKELDVLLEGIEFDDLEEDEFLFK